MHALSPRLPRLAAVSLLILAPLSSNLHAQAQKPEPFRVNQWLNGPSYLKFSGSERVRYEGLNGQFRDNDNPVTLPNGTREVEDQVFSRLLLRADYTRGKWGSTVEGIDARAWGTKANSFANTTTVNTFDVLQANASYQFAEGHKVTVGRYTMDIGSRRLSARNRFRNTINSFNGASWDFAGKDGYSAGAFWAMPTNRRPGSRTKLVDNDHDWDTQSIDYQFYGLHSTQQLNERTSAQLYVLQLSDHRNSVTSRDLTTVGAHVLTPAERGKMFGQAEVAYQFGSRGTADVHAYFVHGSIGKTFDHDMQPTVRVALDIASGNDSNDPDYNRFDTMFGARRFEYGPTGIYGAIGRRNIVSPEVRVSINPSPNTWVLVAARDFRLASQSDGWREAGDTTGTSSDIGQQVECRLRWDVKPKSVRLEGGAVYLSGGQFRETSTAGRSTDTRYFFFEAIFTF
ncbi:MAG: hypothetical protein ACJA0V_000386 [Planctomycetota bacterium]|jgi:hypothetical protein